MIKSITTVLCLQLVALLSNGQNITLGNDSITFTASPILNNKGNISAFLFKLVNQSSEKIAVGITEGAKPVSYVYKVANTLMVFCGGTVPALYDYNPEFLQLSELKRLDTLTFKVSVGEHYKPSATITRNEYIRMRKVMILDYIIEHSNAVLPHDKFKYSDFLQKKQRIYIEIKP